MAVDISENRYRLVLPKETREAFFEAFRRYNLFHKGDFRYLLALRKKDINGKVLDRAGIADSLSPRLPSLSSAVFGAPRRLMWPEMGTYSTLMNSLRGKIIGSVPASDNTLTVDECRLLCDICEFYARLQVGQLTYALERLRGAKEVWGLAGRAVIADFEKDWKQLAFAMGPNTSLGVGNKNATHLKDILFSLYEVVRYRLAWDAYPEGGMTVDFGTPMNWYTLVPLSFIERSQK